MKIRVAIIDSDRIYLEKLSTAIGTRLADKLQVYAFTDAERALAGAVEHRIDVLLAGEQFGVDVSRLPERCGFAYLVDTNDIATLREQRTVGKYQKLDSIYRSILSIYSEKVGHLIGLKVDGEHCRVLMFSSPCGGVGTSTTAVACAGELAAAGRRVLYLNLDPYAQTECFFRAAGQFDMSDLIYALKNRKTNLALKIESCVRQDERGVYFFATTKQALDMLELQPEDVQRLLTELSLTGKYDDVVIDCAYQPEGRWDFLYEVAQVIIWVSDGSQIANGKIVRARQALQMKEEAEGQSRLHKLRLLYNRFRSRSGKRITEAEMTVLGGAPLYEVADSCQIVQQLMQQRLFASLYKA